MRKPDYGIDAPVMQRNLGILGLLAVGMYFVWPQVGSYTLYLGIVLLAALVWLHWGSRVGKLRLCESMLAALPWRGDEQVLDVGCGHGVLTVGAAKRLRSGMATGVDVWNEYDQAQNRPDRVIDNAKIEGVARFVQVKDGDARELPFADETFDIVVTSWAIHNIAVGTGREKAIREIFRVLKPGGWVGILDIEATDEYRREMENLGMANIDRSGPSFIFLMPTYRLIGQKPKSEAG